MHQLVKPGETPITGIAWFPVVDYPVRQLAALMDLKSSYLVAQCDGREEIRSLLDQFPLSPSLGMGPAWRDISDRALPLERTRFDVPAWVRLSFRFGKVTE